ncbi:MAG TPA: acireductone synthase [Candidatus Acidoferrum sp.]|nr:acireductone synthase [Candidatus Acidoferrum sp.]
MSPPFDSAAVRAILLDIEGTTTPVDFVFRTLFPFAAERAEEFLREHWSDTEIKAIVAELRSTWSGAACSGAPVWLENTPEDKIASAAAYVRWLVARDSKITPLKALQGKIWEQGFRSGTLEGQVYPDVAPSLARWRGQGREVAIFSSGSVLAQRLLFEHSTSGNLSACFKAYFDTTTGPKREAASYRKIAAALGFAPREILFVSDVTVELDAARAAGFETALSLRPGVPAPLNSPYTAIASFADLFPDPAFS